MTGRCESCANRATCKKDIGHIWGHCNTDYKPIANVFYTIGVKYKDFTVCKMYSDSGLKFYLKSTRNGKDVGIDAKAEICGDIVTVKDGEIVVV